MSIFAISTLSLLASVAVGKIAARGGSRRDGDIAMAVFASYVIGQFVQLFYWRMSPPQQGEHPA